MLNKYLASKQQRLTPFFVPFFFVALARDSLMIYADVF